MNKSKRALSFDIGHNIYIEEKHLEHLKLIGHGSFGVVWLAKLHDTKVAVKRVSCPIEEEGMILQSVCHPNIVRYLGVVHAPPATFALVMEYAENGSLSQLIHDQTREITLQMQDSYIQQVLAG